MPKLVDAETREEYELSPGVTRLGRSQRNQIRPRGRMISRTHARIEHTGQEWRVEDVGSKVGTYVNGEVVIGPHTLETGDEIRIGTAVLIFDDGHWSAGRLPKLPRLTRVVMAGLAALAALRTFLIIHRFAQPSWLDPLLVADLIALLVLWHKHRSYFAHKMREMSKSG